MLDSYTGPEYPDLPNLPVYAWYLNEREQIRIKREDMRLDPPWTQDPILSGWRFTNVRREDDRVSRELLDLILANGDKPLDQIFFNTVAFRTFNNQIGYEALNGGWISKWNFDLYMKRMDKHRAQNKPIFGNAYMIASTLIKKGTQKHGFYVNLLGNVWKDRKKLLDSIVTHNTLENVMTQFMQYPGYGGFLGYELAMDMEMTGILVDPIDRLTWANAGPGAKRGLNFVFGRDKKARPADPLEEMRYLYEIAPSFLQPHVVDYLDMRFIENGLCETSKIASILSTGRAKRKFR